MIDDYTKRIEEEVERLEEKIDNLTDLLLHLDGLNLKIGIASFYPYIKPSGILAFLNHPDSGWSFVTYEEDYLGRWDDYRNQDKYIRIMTRSKNQAAVEKSYADAFATIYNVYCEQHNNQNKILFLLQLIKEEPL